MSITRYPQLAHWGAYTAVVEDGKLIRCEPFADDPNPSPLLDSIYPDGVFRQTYPQTCSAPLVATAT
ncbi:biotin sulfoxide reductase [Yersinia enterocolitica]|nr:biotin sulfoxide reductase [Yersinia enterocolitica]